MKTDTVASRSLMANNNRPMIDRMDSVQNEEKKRFRYDPIVLSEENHGRVAPMMAVSNIMLTVCPNG